MFNPKQIEKAMKKMGIKTEDLDVEEVIFKFRDKEMVIENPHVSKIKMGDTTTFQIIGELKERKLFSDEDIKIIVDQTGCSREEAEKTLEETKDIAAAILRLKK